VIEFNCPKCNEDLAYPDSLGGTQDTCPNCGHTVDIPIAFYDEEDDADMDLSLDAISDDEVDRIDLPNAEAAAFRATDGDAIDLEPEEETDTPRKQIIHSGAGSNWARKANEQSEHQSDEDAVDLEGDDNAPRKAIVVEERSTTQTRKALDIDAPTIIAQRNLYLIIDPKEMVAYYHPDGWMIHVKDGYVPAKRNEKVIPAMGSFVLVEVVISQDDHGHNRLADIRSFALQTKFALKTLCKGEDAVFETIVSKANLEDKQRKIVRKRIDAKFLPTIWEGAEGLL